MNKNVYIQIRKAHSFELKKSVLFFHLLIDICLLGVSVFLCRAGHGLQFLAIPLVAALMFRNFSLMHEAVHGLVAKNKQVNDLVGLISGALCVLPYEPWKKNHMLHHYWSGNYEKDPVMALISILPKWSPRAIQVISVLWRSWVPVLAFMQNIVFWILSFKVTLNGERNLKAWASILVPMALVIGVVSICSAAVLFQVVIPSVVLYLMAVDVVNLPHHLQLPMISGDQKLAIWDQHEIARTCLYPKWIAQGIALNFNYHSEHHMFPDAPWYTLAKIHEAVHAELGSAQHTDPYFKWIIENRPKNILDVINPNQNAPSVRKAS